MTPVLGMAQASIALLLTGFAKQAAEEVYVKDGNEDSEFGKELAVSILTISKELNEYIQAVINLYAHYDSVLKM